LELWPNKCLRVKLTIWFPIIKIQKTKVKWHSNWTCEHQKFIFKGYNFSFCLFWIKKLWKNYEPTKLQDSCNLTKLRNEILRLQKCYFFGSIWCNLLLPITKYYRKWGGGPFPSLNHGVTFILVPPWLLCASFWFQLALTTFFLNLCKLISFEFTCSRVCCRPILEISPLFLTWELGSALYIYIML